MYKQSWDHAVGGRPQLVALWGRRRVGKTFLLTHFAHGRPHVYFTATRQDSEQRQVQRLYSRAAEQLGERGRVFEPARPADWEVALRLLVETAATEPLLVVIDEMPWLLDGRPDFADLLSAVWENHVHDQRLMLVVTGSAVSAMEEMLGGDGGLRGRPELQLRLDPSRRPRRWPSCPACRPTSSSRPTPRAGATRCTCSAGIRRAAPRPTSSGWPSAPTASC